MQELPHEVKFQCQHANMLTITKYLVRYFRKELNLVISYSGTREKPGNQQSQSLEQSGGTNNRPTDQQLQTQAG